jgi:hypothetical protein
MPAAPPPSHDLVRGQRVLLLADDAPLRSGESPRARRFVTLPDPRDSRPRVFVVSGGGENDARVLGARPSLLLTFLRLLGVLIGFSF